MSDYPEWICGECGLKHGNRPAGNYATWHMNNCDICGDVRVWVTEPRDFGHLKKGWRESARAQE